MIINGVMLGLTPREALERYDQVIDFAELREFEDLKLKNYSSGMQVRLAFSVMVQVDADVLLIDEVLAVGDVAFQQKCFDVFNRLRDEGRTILFVTHDMAAVRRFCHRALLIERGKVRMIGEPDEVAAEYVDVSFDAAAREEEASRRALRRRHGRAGRGVVVRRARRAGGHAAPGQELLASTRACASTRGRRTRPSRWCSRTSSTSRCSPPPPSGSRSRPAPSEPGDEADFSIHLDMHFAPGRIYASPWVARRGGSRILDRRPRMTHGARDRHPRVGRPRRPARTTCASRRAAEVHQGAAWA